MTPTSETGAGPARTYHHGDLRRVLLKAAANEIARTGTADLSLRALARAASVSHAAPAHHFGDKRGLLTALATQGHLWLAAELAAAPDLLELGVAYVCFALDHPAHFEVMFRPDLLHRDDPDLVTARTASRAALTSAAAGTSPTAPRPTSGGGAPAGSGSTEVAAWSLAHGLATLRLTGNLPPTKDPIGSARSALRRLFGGPPSCP